MICGKNNRLFVEMTIGCLWKYSILRPEPADLEQINFIQRLSGEERFSKEKI
jgi:hypothetical protein